MVDHREIAFESAVEHSLISVGGYADELFSDQARADATADESVHDAGEANTIDNFARIFDRRLEELVIDRMDRNSDQVVRFLDNPEVRDFVTSLMRNQVYTRIQQDAKSRIAES
jgi:hypothetical protein